MTTALQRTRCESAVYAACLEFGTATVVDQLALLIAKQMNADFPHLMKSKNLDIDWAAYYLNQANHHIRHAGIR